MDRKAQVSVEYLFIIALSLAIIVPGAALFYTYTNDSNERVIAGQINWIGNSIISDAEKIFTSGKNSWTTIDVSFPESTINAYVPDDYELVIEYMTPRGITEAVFFSNVNISKSKSGQISNNFHTGHMSIKLESKGDYVLIKELIS